MKRNWINIFNIRITNITLEQTCLSICDAVGNNIKGYVVTPNVDHIVKLQKDNEFKEIYDNADLILADGMPLIWASKLLKKPLIEKVSGSDLFPELCKLAAEKGQSVYFLGALPGVAEKAKQVLQEKYSNLSVVGTHSPSMGFEKDDIENGNIIKMINIVKPDILFVGVGAPKQEKWIYNNLSKLDIKVALGIGASFDFIAGSVKRAPRWMQKIGLEWFFRVLQEPKRMFKRYFIEDSKFFIILLKEILKNRKSIKIGNKLSEIK